MEDSIGARLRRAREQRRLSLNDVAEVTKLRLHYLQALENDDLSAMPSAAQARGFLRLYTEYLGLEMGQLLEGLESSGAPLPASAETDASESSAGEPQPDGPRSLSALRRRLPFGRPKASEPARTADASDAGVDEAGDVGKTPTWAPLRDSVPIASEPEGPQGSTESLSPSVASTLGVAPPEGARSETPTHSSSADTDQAAVSAEPEATAVAPGITGHGSLLSRFRPSGLFGRRSDSVGSRPMPNPASAASTKPEIHSVPAQDAEYLSDEPADAPESSERIFADIGRQLRERRELLGLTEDEVERHSRVRAAFVHSLERAAFEDLPSPVQTRGILANYTGFLDLDVDAMLLRFAEGLQARHREQRPEPQGARARASLTVHTSVPPLRSFIASDLVFGVGVAVLLALFAVWGITRAMATRSSAQPDATSPSISDVLAATPDSAVAAEVTLIPAQDTPEAATAEVAAPAGTESATTDPNVALELNLTTSERTYLRVTVDGEVKFEGRTLPGTDYAYQAADRIELLVGNGSALRVTFNGRDLGLMGGFGEVVDRIYTTEGASTPTSTPPPTPTASPNITATPSLTPTPTSTPSSTPTTGG